jgi:sporulation protein YlmC with PRC-barrel domain
MPLSRAPEPTPPAFGCCVMPHGGFLASRGEATKETAMIRMLMASSAVLALAAQGTYGAAYAQADPAVEPPPAIEEEAIGADAAAAGEARDDGSTLKPDQPTIATAFIGRDVYSSEDPESDNIGEVTDLIINNDGAITHAVIGVGGFLGIGRKDVAVPFDELEVFERDGEIRLVYASTREQLEAAEAFDHATFDPWARWADEQAALQPDPVGPGAGGIGPAPGMEQQAIGSAPAEPEEEAAQVNETQEPSAERVDEAGGRFVAEQGENEILATELIGLTVYNPADEVLGDVDDIIWKEDGAEAMIVGVGGFLGIGKKSVAVDYSAFDISTDEIGNKKLVLNATKDELTAAPTFVSTAEKLAMVRAAQEQALPPATGGGIAPAPAPAQ